MTSNSPANRIAQQCLGARLRVLNRVVSGIYDEALRPWGLKISQLNVLVAVARMGEAQPLRLCRVLHLDPSTLSRNVERMGKRGWLQSRPGEDARTQVLRITPEGEALLEAVAPAWQQAQDRVTELLGQEGADAVRALAQPFLRR